VRVQSSPRRPRLPGASAVYHYLGGPRDFPAASAELIRSDPPGTGNRIWGSRHIFTRSYVENGGGPAFLEPRPQLLRSHSRAPQDTQNAVPPGTAKPPATLSAGAQTAPSRVPPRDYRLIRSSDRKASAPWFQRGSNVGRYGAMHADVGSWPLRWSSGIASGGVELGGAWGCLRISCSATELPRRDVDSTSLAGRAARCYGDRGGSRPC
jgi:hypothetical protein